MPHEKPGATSERHEERPEQPNQSRFSDIAFVELHLVPTSKLGVEVRCEKKVEAASRVTRMPAMGRKQTLRS